MAVVFTLLAFLLACGAEKKPDEVLEEDAMVRILMDIYITEEKVNRLAFTRDSTEKIFPLFKDRIYRNAKINDSIFVRSMEYYLAHPKKLERVYSAVIDSLTLREQALAADTTTNNVIPD